MQETLRMEVVKDWLLPSKSICYFLVLVHLSLVITFWNVRVILLQKILAILSGGIWLYLRILNDFIFQWLGTWYIKLLQRLKNLWILSCTCGRWSNTLNFELISTRYTNAMKLEKNLWKWNHSNSTTYLFYDLGLLNQFSLSVFYSIMITMRSKNLHTSRANELIK